MANWSCFTLIYRGELVAGSRNIPLESDGKGQCGYEWNGACGMERVFTLLRDAEADKWNGGGYGVEVSR